jgi:hypothetical protein
MIEISMPWTQRTPPKTHSPLAEQTQAMDILDVVITVYVVCCAYQVRLYKLICDRCMLPDMIEISRPWTQRTPPTTHTQACGMLCCASNILIRCASPCLRVGIKPWDPQNHGIKSGLRGTFHDSGINSQNKDIGFQISSTESGIKSQAQPLDLYIP